ncbi:hypothetical protein HYW35_03475 [Candidatus Saccharibacteria bacterium]|nr:hypothetical protein [Candidatus Saccharibacteria bacterium]
MNEFNKMLKNQTVNNLATAFIFGGATLGFFTSVGNTLFGSLFSTGATWEWKPFFTELVVYVVLIGIAWWVNLQAR